MSDPAAAQVREALDYAALVWSRYRDHGDPADLKAVSGTYRRILAAGLAESLPHEVQSARANLALALIEAFGLTGDDRHLEESLALVELALPHEPAQGGGRLMLLNTRQVALMKRFERDRRPDQLQAAAAAVDELARLAPDTAVTWVNRCNVALFRFDASGSLEALDAAVGHAERAVAAAAEDERMTALGTLAAALMERYGVRARGDDIERAFAAQQQAVALLPAGAPARGEHLLNFGSILLKRYEATREAALLDAAIDAFDAALPKDAAAPVAGLVLQNVGHARVLRFERSGDERDLEFGILACRQAVAPQSGPARNDPGVLANLARGLAARYRLRRDPHDLEGARACYRGAVTTALATAPRTALNAALSWGAFETELEAWAEASAAYRHGLDAAERLFEASALRETQEAWLHESRGLGARAAYAAARAGDLHAAVLALERSRAVVWSRALRLAAADLSGLAAADAALAQRFRDAAERWGLLRSSEAQAGRGTAPAEACTDAWRDLAAVIGEVRARPGFERWLARIDWADVEAAAAAATIVYLAAADAGGIALIVGAAADSQRSPAAPGQPSGSSPSSNRAPDASTADPAIGVVWLPELTDKALRERLRGPDDGSGGGYLGAYAAWLDAQSDAAVRVWSDALDELTRWCWSAAMGPVVAALPGAGRVVLIAAGALGFVPLHAAWTADPSRPSGRRYALDCASFTYAPNASAFAIASKAARERSDDDLLAIENPRSAADDDLPGAAFEVRSAARRFATATVLRGGDASQASTLRLLAQAAAAHFCCHGQARMDDPLASALQLADGKPLTLQEMLDAKLARCRLVVLSACETAVAGTRLPDEGLSLQSGLLQAGAAAAVATSWAVYDTSATLLVARFYDEWRGEPRRPPHEALVRAQQWLRDSSNDDKRAWLRRDPDAALLPADFSDELAQAIADDGPEGRSFAGLLHWAGFTYAGA